MTSPDDILYYGPGASVTDSAGNVYTITATGQLTIIGAIDPPSAGVEVLSYDFGEVYQKNDLNLWYSQTAPNYAVNGWTSYGAGVHPVPFAPSGDDTVVAAGSGGNIIDANANQWTITAGGEVEFDGVADTLTANVIAIAYANGLVWQENASGFWWAKTGGTGSYDGWSPGPGTDNANGSPVSPLPPGTLTWIGGGNNAASNPLDWSTDTVPKAGDTLIMTAGTINVGNSNLAGDVLTVADYDPEHGSVTIDLKGGAALSLADQSYLGDDLAINVTGQDFSQFHYVRCHKHKRRPGGQCIADHHRVHDLRLRRHY